MAFANPKGLTNNPKQGINERGKIMAVSELTQTNRASQALMQQLLDHPNWNKGTEEHLEKDSYIIVERDDSSFCILWLNKEGEKVSVSFTINDEKFWFENGQAHHSYRLDELISEIFTHYK